jgi:hypothetical protein
MSVYKKLQKARVLLNESSIKKSGKNKFAGYEYFELGDFIPTINAIFDKVGLCGVVSFNEQATLTVFDTDGDGQIVFATPIVYAENAKGQAIQSLGSTHTYLRRYLWLMAMEIVENDSVDSLPQQDKPKPAIEVKSVSPVVPVVPTENFDALASMMIEFGATCEDLKELSSFWSHNKSEIDAMKKVNPELFKELQTKFAEYKAKFKE